MHHVKKREKEILAYKDKDDMSSTVKRYERSHKSQNLNIPKSTD